MHSRTHKPRFRRLRDAIEYIRDELPVEEERRIWMAMHERDLREGGGWD